MKYLLLTLITFSFMSFSQEEEPSRELADGVIELTTVKGENQLFTAIS